MVRNIINLMDINQIKSLNNTNLTIPLIKPINKTK